MLAAIRNGDVDVQAEDQERPGELLQLFDDVLVALAGGDDLILPPGKGVRAGGGDAEAYAFRAVDELAADAADLVVELFDVGADLRADLDDRLVELALELITESRGARYQELGNMGSQLPRVRVDYLELFFDADGEREPVIHRLES